MCLLLAIVPRFVSEEQGRSALGPLMPRCLGGHLTPRIGDFLDAKPGLQVKLIESTTTSYSGAQNVVTRISNKLICDSLGGAARRSFGPESGKFCCLLSRPQG